MTTSTFHHTTIGETEHSWPVDIAAAATLLPWARRRPAVLQADLAGMAAAFPHWLLIGTRAGKIAACPQCRAPAAPIDGALRCAVCRMEQAADALIWAGHIPALIRPEAAFTRRLGALRAAGFSEIEAGGLQYVLVPLQVHYPAEWPGEEPIVRYSRRWLEAIGLPHSSSAHHLIQGGRACIFTWGQWCAQPIHAVLQQRMINHIASLLKIAAGQSPQHAFIGRIHNDQWAPE